MKLSIILPCYNIADFLPRCFDSILSQKVDFEYEIIAVNDASTDNTLEMLLLYASKNKNMLIIDKKVNGKLSGARTTGIQNACGDYIMHIDPDDYLLPDTLNKLFSEEIGDFEMKIFNIMAEEKNDSTYLKYSNKLPHRFILNNLKDSHLFFKTFYGPCYGKVIKRTLLENLCYYEFNYNIGEDIAFNFEVFNRCKIVYFDPTPIYFYCFNNQSLIRSAFNIDRLNTSQSWIENVKRVISNKGVSYKDSEYRIKLLAERYTVGLLLQIKSIVPKEKRSEILNLWEEFISSLFDLIDSSKSNLYKFALKISNEKIKCVIFLILLGQNKPYFERVKKLFSLKRLKLKKQF
jgi:glycosyltransferase involved in cell wall biosynthesis